MRSGIYLIKNLVTGYIYVGSALSIIKRLQQHRRDLTRNQHDNARLQHAWNKYGPSAFDFSVIECVLIPDDLLSREQYWIDTLSASTKPNYNICPTAGSSLGRKAAPETRAKMSATRTGRKQTPEAIAKTAAAHRGRKRSPETRKKLSDANRGRAMHPNTRAAILRALTGFRHSEASKEKMRAAKTGWKPSAEARARMSAAKLGNQHTLGFRHKPESIAKMSQSKRKALRDGHGRFVIDPESAGVG